MKQFVFLKGAAKTGDLSALSNGDYGFKIKNSQTLTDSYSSIKNEFELVVKEGEYINTFPIHTNKLTSVLTEPVTATAFSAIVTIAGTVAKGTYSLIIVKKGAKFNERNKWTASVYVPANKTLADIANELAKQINNFKFVTASVNTASDVKLTITGVEKGIDYEVLAADDFENLTVTIAPTNAKQAVNDAAGIADLFAKCAADRGINYTYQESNINPSLPFNPLKGSDSADTGFDVVTLRFAEPRVVKTTDEVINQVLHVVLPKGKGAAFNTIINTISNGAEATSVSETALED